MFLGIEFTEWIGYIGSAIVLISFLMKSMKTLRLINTLGCLIFVVYGFVLDISWPIVFTNLAIAGINIFYLIKKPK